MVLSVCSPTAFAMQDAGGFDRLDEQPMDFYLRQMEEALGSTRHAVANFRRHDRREFRFCRQRDLRNECCYDKFPTEAQ